MMLRAPLANTAAAPNLIATEFAAQKGMSIANASMKFRRLSLIDMLRRYGCAPHFTRNAARMDAMSSHRFDRSQIRSGAWRKLKT